MTATKHLFYKVTYILDAPGFDYAKPIQILVRAKDAPHAIELVKQHATDLKTTTLVVIKELVQLEVADFIIHLQTSLTTPYNSQGFWRKNLEKS